ncbi:hypothetical protein GGR52DRAFT_567506 [Hypoxylon sp. FL1284]|nr:hypothetical protein GGR52DRAFT_567506 [Hypoxylon sp. FL1284]
MDSQAETENKSNATPAPIRSNPPNNLIYYDDDGVEHSIYLPPGTMHEAWDHVQNKRWGELAKFAPYTDQEYSESDFKSEK